MNICLFLLLVFFCAAGEPVLFDGFLSPADALSLVAPRNELRAAGSGSSSSGIRLRSRMEETGAVKKGDILLVFRNDAEDDFNFWVKNKLNTAIAEAEKNLLNARRLIEQKQAEIINLDIATRKIEIDLQSADVLPQREVAQLRLDLKIAELRVSEAGLELKKLENEARYTELTGLANVQIVREEIKYLEEQCARFELRSPIDGYVFFPKHPRFKRPIQDGDSLNCGSVCALVAPEKKMEVEFYVPEFYYKELREGRQLSVTVGRTGVTYPAVLSSFNRFPMPLAFLRDDSWLPNGQERYFVGRAEFVADSPEPAEGLELKVSF
jgi:hypothetical protein